VYHLHVVEHRGSSTLVRLRYVDSRTPFIPNPCRTLLEFRLNGESGALCDTVTLDVPVADVARFLELNGGQTLFVRSPFLTIPCQHLVFDTRTRVFFTLVCYDQQRVYELPWLIDH
jgi:hypothetical protein